MKRGQSRASRAAAALFICVAIGFGLGWTLRGHAPRPASDPAPHIASLSPTSAASAASTALTAAAAPSPKPVATAGDMPSADSAVDALRQHTLRVPIDGANVESFRGQFADPRDAGHRPHEAVDILAPRDTPVHAVENGTIAKLFFSKGGGGITIYQNDPTGRFCYYYAHLARYADGLREGQTVAQGEVIGFVGTTGNAPPNTPHLHFAVFELGADRRWWKGRPIDPYSIFSHHSS